MRNVHKRFGATVALGGVDLEVAAGEVLGLVGENGAGKSTLMKVLSGAHPADEGQMWLDGAPYAPSGPLAARRAGVAMIYQELSLAPHLSVTENIVLGVEPRRLGAMRWRQARATAAAALHELGRDDIPLDAPAGSLSVGRQQLVEIARAVAVGARVLVLDEPTSSLSAADIARLFDLVRRLRGRGYAIVYISHFLEEIAAITDRFTVLRDGRSVGGGVTAQATPQQIIRLMVGRDVSELYPRSKRECGEVVLGVTHLAGAARPADASLTLRRGEVLGIAGLVGAGRTELLRAIFGLDPVRRGIVRVHQHTGPATPAQRWRQGAGFVSEDRKSQGLALGLSIADNLTLSHLRPLGPRGLVLPARRQRMAQRWIDALGIRCREPQQPVEDLSGGNQQKVAIARLLHHDCDVLLLDEPTRGIDVASKAHIYRLIDELARQGKALLVVSSYLPELLGICDRIAVMHRGVLGEACAVSQTDENRIMAQATGAVGGAAGAGEGSLT
jgi:ribose transport system ATP-binding protein